MVLVIKKHRSILDNLRTWILDNSVIGDAGQVRDFPILVIDDEADDASIGTQNPFINGVYRPDEVDPTAINRAIRDPSLRLRTTQLRGVHGDSERQYLHPSPCCSEDHGPDLFPRDFIEYLRPPTNYFGPTRCSGPLEDVDPAPLAEVVVDYPSWIPDRHPNGHVPGPLPQTVNTALRTFVLVRATRLARGQVGQHNTMLVHVSRFQSVQNAVLEQLREALDDLRGRIRFEPERIIPELRELWQQTIAPVTAAYPNIDPALIVEWSEVEALLTEAIGPIQLRLLNGTSQDALEYFEHSKEGLNVIVVGGK